MGSSTVLTGQGSRGGAAGVCGALVVVGRPVVRFWGAVRGAASPQARAVGGSRMKGHVTGGWLRACRSGGPQELSAGRPCVRARPVGGARGEGARCRLCGCGSVAAAASRDLLGRSAASPRRGLRGACVKRARNRLGLRACRLAGLRSCGRASSSRARPVGARMKRPATGWGCGPLSSAVLTGFEPAASTLTGWRALQTAPQDLARRDCTAGQGVRSNSPLCDDGSRSAATAVRGRRVHGLHDALVRDRDRPCPARGRSS